MIKRKWTLFTLACLLFITTINSCKEEVILIPTVFETQLYHSEQTLNAVYFIDESREFVAGNNGTLLSTINGGKSWNKYEGYNTNLNCISFGSDSVGYISGKDDWGRILLKTTDAGDTWNTVSINNYVDLISISFPSPDTGYALGSDEVFLTTNGGQSWSLKILPYEVFDPELIFFSSGRSGIVIDWEDNVFGTKDCGEIWDVIPISGYHINDVFFIDNNNGCFVDSHGDIYIF